jgi:hypothetical protein
MMKDFVKHPWTTESEHHVCHNDDLFSAVMKTEHRQCKTAVKILMPMTNPGKYPEN